MASIRKIVSALSDKRISIAMIGLKNSGKSSLAANILPTDECLKANVSSKSDVEFYMYGNLTIITWDLEKHIPQERGLWKRSVLGADVLFFILDSTDKEKFDLDRKLLFELVELNSPIKILILGTKSDLSSSMPLDELKEALNLSALDESKCHYSLIKCSSLTGEGLFAIGEWLDKLFFKRRERIINYIRIKASLILDETGEEISEALFVSKTDLNFLTAFQELKRKTKVFSRTMRTHSSGETVIEIANYKVALVKERPFILALLFGSKDSVLRAFEISQKVLKLANSLKDQEINIKELIGDLYPLDVR